ncbi:MAG: hypothetical protein JW839_03275 [Candidatus Lokiarchaeota archaeon]|nr:hypothetical protein [Candidatus Lokiarchaeota archaeon]
MKLKNWHIGVIIGSTYSAVFAPLIVWAISLGIDIDLAMFVLLPGLFGLLLGLFIYQTTTRERNVPFLITSLVFGVLSGIFSIMREMAPAIGIPEQSGFFLSLHMNCAGFQFLFFYLFIEGIREFRPKPWRLVLAFGLSELQTISLWLIYWFNVKGASTEGLWFFADLGYNTLGLFTFLGCALPVYVQSFRLTKEPRSAILFVAVILVGASFVMSSVLDYNSELHLGLDLDDDIGSVNDVLALGGILLFTIVYVSNVDYLYRLPADNYALMVSLKTGETIHFVRFKTRSKVDLNQDLLSGLLSTINLVFQSIMTTSSSITEISSSNATLLSEPGRWITATVITEKPSAILDKALKRYVDHFERMFAVRLADKSTCVTDYDSARTLLKKMFPFFVVDDDHSGGASPQLAR